MKTYARNLRLLEEAIRFAFRTFPLYKYLHITLVLVASVYLVTIRQ